MPWGTKIPVKRVFGTAAVLARGVCAGIIESSSGSARATPAPRRTVRRDMCFFVRNIGPSTSRHTQLARSALLDVLVLAELHLLVHLERIAFYDTHHERGKLVIIALRRVDNRTNQRHIIALGASTQCID